MSLKLAIWDMDGTIVDSRQVIQNAMAAAFEACDLAAPSYEQTRQIVGLGLEEAVKVLAPEYGNLSHLVEQYKQAFIRHRAEAAFHEPLYEGAIETLDRLANSDWLIAMATGKSHRGIRALFETHALEHYFDTIWCADDGPGKPHPFMCEQAMGALGAEPAQSLMIGDAVFDMQMGRAAGVYTLGVSWGFGRSEELEAAGAHEIHHDFASLNQALNRFEMALAE